MDTDAEAALSHSYSRRDVLRRGAGGFAAVALGGLALPRELWAADAKEPVKIAMILPGPINDHEFNTVGYSALQRTGKALGVKTAYAESVSSANAARLLRNFASKGYNPIIAHSFGFGPQTVKVAKSFPDTTFMDLSPPMTKNVGNYDNPDYQGAYLAGMLAAGTTKTRTIGWVSTLPIPSLNANFHAFEAGAKSVKPDIKVLHSFIGTFFDPPKGKEAALAQIQRGADVVSAQTAGVIDACVASNKFAIGAITDQNRLGPKNVLTSITWNLTPIITQVAREVANGTWKSRLIRPGIAGGEIGVAPFHGLQKNVDPTVFKQFQAKYAAMKAGKFKVPENTSKIS
jgi:basic membrane lipoprotein Med (substrate-binding protein (PBP1-ABC) superfamily)